MFMAGLILVFSTAMFFFYWQVTVQKILRRSFEHAYFKAIATANQLEFPALRSAFEGPNGTVDYTQLRQQINCDFRALTYLLKNACNTKQSYSNEERLLMVYFRVVLFSLSVRHVFKLGEKSSVINLASVLQYFANVVGERVDSVRLGNLSAADYILSL